MSRAEWIVSPPTHGGRMRSWSLSVFAAFAVPASRLYIYLASVERQRILIRDGIQTLVFRPSKQLTRVRFPANAFPLARADVEAELLLWLLAAPETFGWVVRQQKRTSSPRRGIEPRSSAWQAEILSTILTRSWECKALPPANDTALTSLYKAWLFLTLAQTLHH